VSDKSQPKVRGVIALNPADCTSCMLCVRQCPTWCISLESHQAPDPNQPAGARERLVNVLDDFVIDFGKCMSCGVCVEVCPFDALQWESEIDYAESDKTELAHSKNKLAEHWVEIRPNNSN